MAKNKPLDRYVEAGKEFTEASRKCLEDIAHGLARESGAGREHAEDWAEELVERGRRAAEQLSELVRREVGHQIKQFNLATNQDVIKTVQHFVERTTKAAAPVMDAASRTMAARKMSVGKKAGSAKKQSPADKAAPAKKAAVKKAAVKKTAVKRAPAAAKAAVKRAPAAVKAAVKRAPAAAKAPAKKAVPAKKVAAKKAAATKKSQPSDS
jgi:hypothetical protein